MPKPPLDKTIETDKLIMVGSFAVGSSAKNQNFTYFLREFSCKSKSHVMSLMEQAIK